MGGAASRRSDGWIGSAIPPHFLPLARSTMFSVRLLAKRSSTSRPMTKPTGSASAAATGRNGPFTSAPREFSHKLIRIQGFPSNDRLIGRRPALHRDSDEHHCNFRRVGPQIPTSRNAFDRPWTNRRSRPSAVRRHLTFCDQFAEGVIFRRDVLAAGLRYTPRWSADRHRPLAQSRSWSIASADVTETGTTFWAALSN